MQSYSGQILLRRDRGMEERLTSDLYCYVAYLVEDTGVTELTDDELVDGLQHESISIPAAIERMKASQPTSELERFIKERDLFFVEKYADAKGA